MGPDQVDTHTRVSSLPTPSLAKSWPPQCPSSPSRAAVTSQLTLSRGRRRSGTCCGRPAGALSRETEGHGCGGRPPPRSQIHPSRNVPSSHPAPAGRPPASGPIVHSPAANHNIQEHDLVARTAGLDGYMCHTLGRKLQPPPAN